MQLCTSNSMHLKRDIYSEDDGFLYEGIDERGLGAVYVLKSVPALCRTPEDFELSREEMTRKQ